MVDQRTYKGHRCRECGQRIPPTPLSKHYAAQGFTLRQLGKKTGLSPSSLSRMSRGNGVTLKSMRSVADALGLTLDSLADLIEAGATSSEEGSDA